ncbi:two-component system sensor histidine kinase RcsC [Providencia sneebia]
MLGLMLWGMGAFITLFILYAQFNESKSDIRQHFYSGFETIQSFIVQTGETLNSIQSMTEQHRDKLLEQPNYPLLPTDVSFSFYSLLPGSDCEHFKEKTKYYRNAFEQLIYFWKDSIAAPQGLNHVFIIGSKSYCMIDFPIRTTVSDIEILKKTAYESARYYSSLKLNQHKRNLYTIVHSAQPDSGQIYLLQPTYHGNIIAGYIGLERSIKLSQFNPHHIEDIEIFITTPSNHPVLYYPANADIRSSNLLSISDHSFFGFSSDYSKLIFKKRLAPSSMTLFYTAPISEILAGLKAPLFYGAMINIFTGCLIFFLIWFLERKMLVPAANTAIRLEEHEQFNHKIVASAPVGIIILRLSDGGNILSNELAHNYFRLLSEDDKQRILTIIRQKSSQYIDVVTSNSTHLQISFVNSRYQNEDVAICVLIDISTRVQMEKSLQDVADAAEQANQAKSMFLATVSHELRTPLYGIIGNIELLQGTELSEKANRLVNTMDNSSSLLLQIISDILDFSKIESEQLKIENKLFNCRDVFSFVLENYLPLFAKKQISVYSCIEPDVPDLLLSDSVRLQQVISNIVNNSIKFTDSGFVLFYVWSDGNYLKIEIRDSGIGMTEPVILKLFDPFFQVYDQNNIGHKGTGLGLAICEKLINLMDGDIEVSSQSGLGSSFIIRIPLYDQKYITKNIPEYRSHYKIAIICQNSFLANFLVRLLRHQHFDAFSSKTVVKNKKYDLLITDNNEISEINAQKEIVLNGLYVGDLKEIAPNKWLFNTYQNEKLPIIIDKIISKMMQEQEPSLKEESHQVEQSADNSALGSHRVLIVDDHPINRLLLSEQISNIGFKVCTAIDGLDALKYIEEHEIDIVLSDVNMPNMDGYELARALRKTGYTLPIIALTANAMAEEKQRCIDAGMDDCLSKPTKINVLKETLLKYCH